MDKDTRSENEKWYDSEIAPVLSELGKRCNERGVSFISCVEYNPGDRGGTYYLTKDAGVAMIMLRVCAMSAPDVDSYIINLKRYADRTGLDVSSSWVLTR